MFTSKRPFNAKKKAKQQQQQQAKSTAVFNELSACVKKARAEYDTLAVQKAMATSPVKIADLTERMRVHADISEINALIKFHAEPVIANNVIFGKIDPPPSSSSSSKTKGDEDNNNNGSSCKSSSSGGGVQNNNYYYYGFICNISKRGDITEVIRVESGFESAKKMVTDGTLTWKFKTASKNLFADELARIEKARVKGIASALKAASLVGDDADDDMMMINESTSLQALISAFEKSVIASSSSSC
jgi:hypothetical protein